MRTTLEGLIVIGVIALAILIGELPAVKTAGLVIDAHRDWLLPLTIGVTGVGFVLLVWGWSATGIQKGTPMTREEIEQLAAKTQILGPGKRYSKTRLWGKTTGVKVDPPDTWTFQEMKGAWRSGAWRRDADMRRKYVATAGGVLFILGLFALFFVVFDPASVKLLIGATLLYATVRLYQGFRRA